MTPLFAPLLCLLLAAYGVSSEHDKVEEGYELLYESNTEELENHTMSFTGNAPRWLNGTLVRVGPAQFEIGQNPKSEVASGLDGFAKVAVWNFQPNNNNLLFSTRFVNSTYLAESRANNKFTSNIFLQPPLPALTAAELNRSQEVGIDNMDISVMDFSNPQNDEENYVATNDILSVYEISLGDLSTLGKKTPEISGTSSSSDDDTPDFLKRLSTSHPLPEPNTENNRINIVIEAALKQDDVNTLRVVRMKSLEETEVIASIQISEVPLLHSFSVTETKVVFIMNPYILNTTCMVNNAGDCYTWKTGNEQTRVYVVDLQNGNVKDVLIPKTFAHHHINAYDISNEVVIVDIASYDSPVVITKFSLEKVRDLQGRNQIDPRATMKRICIHLSNNTATLTDIPSPNPTSKIASTLDYPVINEANRSAPYCYVYGIVERLDGKHVSAMGIAKKDVCTKDNHDADALYQRVGWYPSEPTFVANPSASAEDDGILLVPYTSGEDRKTHLVILDAKDLSFVDIATGPTHIPQSQHGKYFEV